MFDNLRRWVSSSLSKFSIFRDSAPAYSSRKNDDRDDDDEWGDRFDKRGSREKLKAGVPIPAFLPYFDLQQTADETQEMRFAYRRMLGDPNVKANFYAKIMSVMSLDWVVKPPKWMKKDERSIEIAEFVEWNLKHGLHDGMVGLVWDILSGALMDGFSVCEKVWGEPEESGRWKGKRRLACLKAKDVNQDLVMELDEFKNVKEIRGLRYNAGKMFDPKDFVIYSHMGLFENPTGMSDFRAVYRPYWFLDTAWKLRMIACEKRAMPVIVGHWKDATHVNKLEAALARIRYQNWISAPESAQIEALDIAGQSHQIFAETVRDLREEITIGLKGAMLQSMTGLGERGDSKVHKDTSDLFGWHLSAAITNILNGHRAGLIPDIVDRNYSGVQDYPLAAPGGVDDAELGESLKIDQGLSQLVQPMGKRLVIDELEDRYGRKFEDSPQPMVGPDGQPMVGPDGQPIPAGAGGAGGGELTDEDFAGLLSDDGGGDGETFSETWQGPNRGERQGTYWVSRKTGEKKYQEDDPGGVGDGGQAQEKGAGGAGAPAGGTSDATKSKAAEFAKKFAAEHGDKAHEKIKAKIEELAKDATPEGQRKLAAAKAVLAEMGEEDPKKIHERKRAKATPESIQAEKGKQHASTARKDAETDREKEDAEREAKRKQEDEEIGNRRSDMEERHAKEIGEMDDQVQAIEDRRNALADSRAEEDEAIEKTRTEEDEAESAIDAAWEAEDDALTKKRDEQDAEDFKVREARDSELRRAWEETDDDTPEEAAAQKAIDDNDAKNEKEDAEIEAAREAEDDAIARFREKENAKRIKNDEKVNKQREKEDAKLESDRDKEDAKLDKEEAALEKKRDKLEAKQQKEIDDLDEEESSLAEDRDSEDEEIDAGRSKDDELFDADETAEEGRATELIDSFEGDDDTEGVDHESQVDEVRRYNEKAAKNGERTRITWYEGKSFSGWQTQNIEDVSDDDFDKFVPSPSGGKSEFSEGGESAPTGQPDAGEPGIFHAPPKRLAGGRKRKPKRRRKAKKKDAASGGGDGGAEVYDESFEQKHPRDHGEFATKPGASGTAKKPVSKASTQPDAHPGSVHGSSVSIKPSKERAFDGKNPVQLKTTLTKQETGRVGEAVVLAYLKSQGFADAKPMNSAATNFPVDLIEDHAPTEVKAGLASNGRKAQQWRLTFSKESAKEKALYDKMSGEQRATWNAKKQQRIRERKEKVLAAIEKASGKKAKPRTITTVLNPDTKTADIYVFEGWHDRIDWQSPEAVKAYKESVSYAH